MDYQNSNKILTFFIILLISASVKAQKSADMGASTGALFYIGELSNQAPEFPPNLVLGAFYRSNQSAYWAINTSLSIAKLSASDSHSHSGYQQERNNNFENFITDISVTSQFNFTSYYPKGKEIRVVPYLSTGIGAFMATGMGVFPIQPKIVFASGVKWNLNKKINFALELNYNYTFSDYLDKLGSEASSGRGSKFALKQSAQNFNNDGYINLQLNVAFELSKSTKYDCKAY